MSSIKNSACVLVTNGCIIVLFFFLKKIFFRAMAEMTLTLGLKPGKVQGQ